MAAIHSPLAGLLSAACLLAPCLALGAPLGIAPNPPPTAALHLRWNECYGGPNAAIDRSFACDTETGFDDLVLSFAPAVVDSGVQALRAWVDIGFDGGPVPWWELSTTNVSASGCRAGIGRVLLAPNDSWSCVPSVSDPISVGALWSIVGPGIWTPFPHPSPNVSEQLKLEWISASPTSFTPDMGEVFLGAIQIRHTRTTGATACSGCSKPVCLAFTGASFSRANGQYTEFTPDYAQGIGWNVTWQGAATGNGGCPGLIPTRNRTWGAIKSMYR